MITVLYDPEESMIQITSVDMVAMVFVLYGFCCYLYYLTVFFFLPETAKKSAIRRRLIFWAVAFSTVWWVEALLLKVNALFSISPLFFIALTIAIAAIVRQKKGEELGK